MALLMLDICLVFISIIPFYIENIRLYAILDPVFHLSITLLFPLVYFYIRSVSGQKSVSQKDIVHLGFPIFFFLGSIFLHIFLNDQDEYLYAYQDFTYSNASLELRLIDSINKSSKIYVLLQIAWYFFHCLKLIHHYRSRVDNYFSNIEGHYFHWIILFYFAYSGGALAGIFLMFAGNARLNSGNEVLFSSTFFFLSAVFFTIAYIANQQRYIENGQFYIEHEEDCPDENNSKQKNCFPPELKEKFEYYIMSDKPFLNPDLKITDLASSLGTNRTYISNLIKESYNNSFSGYINSLRVIEATLLFTKNEHKNYTTKAISESVGFNNYNSFVKAFREQTGQTPGRFREEKSE